MPITDDIRKTLTDPTPLYFAAGIIDKIREEAPERIAAVRATDPKEVQAKLTEQAKETQAKVSDALGTVDTDIKKLREQAQQLALQSVGAAAEYAVKAREAYDEFADRGRGAVKTWRGEEEDAEAAQVTVERETVKVAQPPVTGTGKTQKPQSPGSETTGTGGSAGSTATGTTSASSRTAKNTEVTEEEPEPQAAARKAPSARKATGTGTAAGTGSAGTAGNTGSTNSAKNGGTKKSAPKSDS